jgi:hypothetical protein
MFQPCRLFWRFRSIFLIVFIFSGSASIHAQSRLNDKDLEALIKNLKDDAKTFRSDFDDAVKKSAIRKTSQEKDARNVVEGFEKQADAMLNEFKKSKKGDVAVESTLSSAQEVDRMLQNMPFDAKISNKWEKIQLELQQVSSGFGINISHRPRR